MHPTTSKAHNRILRMQVGTLANADAVRVVIAQFHSPRVAFALLERFGIATQKALARLSYREREIIKLRYGLGDGYSYTLEEVGHIFKVTRERIRRIEAKTTRALDLQVREELQKHTAAAQS